MTADDDFTLLIPDSDAFRGGMIMGGTPSGNPPKES
jgi:hypothetical protein